jgi:hypothetical protein
MQDQWGRWILLIITYVLCHLENPSQCLLSIGIVQVIFSLRLCSYWTRRKPRKQMMKCLHWPKPRKSLGFPGCLCVLALDCQGHRQQSMISKKMNTKASMPFPCTISFSFFSYCAINIEFPWSSLTNFEIY